MHKACCNATPTWAFDFIEYLTYAFALAMVIHAFVCVPRLQCSNQNVTEVSADDRLNPWRWIVFGIDQLLQVTYPHIHGDLAIFAAIFPLAVVVVGKDARAVRRNLKPDWLMLTVPVSYHCASLVLLFQQGSVPTALVVMNIVALVVGVLGFTATSLDLWLPRRLRKNYAPGA